MIHLRSISRRALLVATSSSTFALLSARFARAQDLASDAANRAVEISALEAARNFDAVYDLLHPDAQAFIPRAAVVGWYEDFLSDQEAGVLTVTGVSIVSWQWPVTGQTYDQTAEVSFVQPYTRNGVTSNEPEIVRLVDPGDGLGPRWFFGRSREFVDAQIALYPEAAASQQDGTGEYEMIELGVLPGLDYSSPDAINNDGLVAGTCFLRGNPGFAGFVWENGEMQALAERTGQPGNINFPSDVNNSGAIVGGSSEFEERQRLSASRELHSKILERSTICQMPSRRRSMMTASLWAGALIRFIARILSDPREPSSGLTARSRGSKPTAPLKAMRAV